MIYCPRCEPGKLAFGWLPLLCADCASLGENSGMPDPKFVKQERGPDPGMIHTHSIVSHRTGRGIVVVEWNGQAGQFDPEDARVFAHTILRECDNAETDAFLLQFLQQKIGLDLPAVFGVLVEFRRERARREQLAGLRPTGQPVPDDDAR